ncbi:MAG TPA: secretin N-terminal domain-containing protein [Phycisphaerae bacterium]|nr:secretin N-terminal domain-containing protein [Phycisphaerae bacterium]HRW52900.1 secretin N-terminal domain-containing protein [Phycisphaerae bacterium]
MKTHRLFMLVALVSYMSAGAAWATCPPTKDANEEKLAARRAALRESASRARDVRRQRRSRAQAEAEAADAARVASEAGLKTIVLSLRHSEAMEVSNVLNRLIKMEGTEDAPKIVFDTRTNSIIVRATDTGVEQVCRLVEQLDVAPSEVERQIAESEMRTRMELMIYEVALPRERLADVNAKLLTAQAETPQSFESALGKLGGVSLVYRSDQLLHTERRSQTTRIGSNSPYVRGVNVSKDGTRSSSVSYEDLGFIVKASGHSDSATQGDATVEIEFKGVTNSSIAIGDGVMAPVMRTFNQNFRGAFKSGEPIVLLLIDAQAGADPVAYVTRIQFDIESL